MLWQDGEGWLWRAVVDAEGVVISEAYCEQADLSENNGRR